MSLDHVRQCRAFSVAYRKPGRHVQRNLLAQAKGEEMVEEGAQCKNVGHFKAGKQPQRPVVTGGEGVGFIGQQEDCSPD